MNPGYIAIALVVGAVFVSTSSALAATSMREGGQGQGAEMRRGAEDGSKSLFIGTVLSVSDTTLTVTPRGFGSSTDTVAFVVDTTKAEIIRVTKTPGSVNSATTTVAVSEIQTGELVSITGTQDKTNHTMVATEVRVGEFVAMFGRGGDMRGGQDGNASSTGPLKDKNLNQKKDRATTFVGINIQRENRGLWQKFKGFFGFK